MSGVKISEMTPSSTLTGAELVEIVQDGSTRRMTTGQLAVLVPVTAEAIAARDEVNAAVAGLTPHLTDIETVADNMAAVLAAPANAAAASTAKTQAEAARDAASGHSTTAGTHATTAGTHAATAGAHANTAGTHATNAEAAKNAAETARDVASGHASAAQGYQNVASTKANEATAAAADAASALVAIDVQQGALDNAVFTAQNKAAEAATSATAAKAAESATKGLYGDANALSAAQQFTLTQVAAAAAQASLAAGYAASAASVAQQDLSGVDMQALHRSPNAITAAILYDTSQDSDGGAWVEKCGANSWQNEPLNGKWLPTLNPHGTQNDLEARCQNATVGADMPLTTIVGTGVSLAGGVLTFTNAVTGAAMTTGSGSATAGTIYRFVFRVRSISGAFRVYAGNSSLSPPITTPGTYTVYLPCAGGTALSITSNTASPGLAAAIDNIGMAPVTAFTTASGDFYQLSTDGKFYRLQKNMLLNSVFAGGVTGTIGSGAVAPTTWGLAGTSGYIEFSDSTRYPGSRQCRFSANAERPFLGSQTVAIAVGAAYSLSGYVEAVTSGAMSIASLMTFSGNPAGSVMTYRKNGTAATSSTGVVAGDFIEVILSGATASGTAIARCGLGVSGNATGDVTLSPPQVELLPTATSPATAYEANALTSLEVFRGNTAKFPRMSAIVAEAANVTIYDLTQPGRPMWMRFERGGTTAANINMLMSSTQTATSLAMLNGELQVGTSGSGLRRINFITDGRIAHGNVDVVRYNGNIAQRQSGLGQTTLTGGALIGHIQVNAVAIMVRPNAPIDPATLMPVPTIGVAVGTGNAGIVGTVLMDDGTAVNYTGSDGSTVSFTKRGEVVWGFASVSGIIVSPLATASGVVGSAPGARSYHNATNPNLFAGVRQPLAAGNVIASRAGSTNRVLLVRENPASPGLGAVADITGTYSTGPMTGDIRRCLLADTVSGTSSILELAPSPHDFTVGWNPNAGTTINDATSFTTTTASGPILPNVLVIGRRYTVTLNIANSVTVNLFSSGNLGAIAAGAARSVTLNFTADGTQFYIRNTAASTTTVTSLSITEVVADRSSKQRDLTINGVMTRTPVAAGAQLVAWSGFGGGWLDEKTYSADLDLGTAGGTVAVWGMVPTTLDRNAYNLATGVNVAANSGFDTDTVWSKGTGWTISGGTANKAAGSSTTLVQSFGAANAGRVYRVACTVSNYTAGSLQAVGLAGSNEGIGANGSFVGYVRANASGFVGFLASATFAGSIDDVVIQEVGCGVAVDRSGYNALPGSHGAGWWLGVDAFGYWVGEVFDGTTTRRIVSSSAYNDGIFHKVRLDITNTSLTLRVDGEQVSSTGTFAAMGSLNNSNALLAIGRSAIYQNDPFPGSLALVKIGATVPSMDMGRWIYNLEKQMFRAGAQITLPDTGAVLGFDYDPITEELAVVTAANRCRFSGLIRTFLTAVPAGTYSRVFYNAGVSLASRISVNPGVDITMPALGLRSELVNRTEAAARLARLEQPHVVVCTASQTDFTLPSGYETVDVNYDRQDQYEGATADYIRVFDGFRETVRFATGRAAGLRVRIMMRRTL